MLDKGGAQMVTNENSGGECSWKDFLANDIGSESKRGRRLG